METPLSKYDLDKLAQRVEGGSDSDGQKAEPILIAKAMTELQNAITALHNQIPLTGVEIRTTISRATDKLAGSVDKLHDEIQVYSKSSDRYANAMKWLTFALVAVGIIQVVISFIKN